MNAIELLDLQHRDVDDLFARLEREEGDARGKLFNDLADLLAIHSTIEELHFYPAVKAAAREAQEEVKHSLEEHVGIKRQLSLCMAIRIADETFRKQLAELKREVQHHVAEEREELFPLVRRLFDEDQLEAIGQEMASTMAELQKGRPRFDVPLQTVAPMPAAQLPMQTELGSRLIPRLSRVLALPLQMVGVARMLGHGALHPRDVVARAKDRAERFVVGVQRGMHRKREA